VRGGVIPALPSPFLLCSDAIVHFCQYNEKKLEITKIDLQRLQKRSPLESFLFELLAEGFAFASYGVRPDAVGECQAMMAG
jgi:hypothetical protein